jgi:hypothetical protein
MPDLLLFAKHLFVAAMAMAMRLAVAAVRSAAQARSQETVGGGGHELTEEKGPGRWSWGASQAGA